MAIGGMVLGPAGILAGGMFKKHSARAVDARELYLLVETNELAFSAPVAADKGVQARSFAARVLTTAKQAVVAEPQRPDELAHAKLALETARQPDAEIIDLRTRVIDLRNLRNEHVVKAR